MPSLLFHSMYYCWCKPKNTNRVGLGMRQVPSDYLLLTGARILRPRIVSGETRVTLAHSKCRLRGNAVGWAGHAGSEVG